MPVKITYFVHGTTLDNEQGLATGWLPGVLSEKGKRQSEELGRTLDHKIFDAVFCSDLKRAVDSAELMFGEKYELIQDRRLRECNYGSCTGKPAKDFKNNLHKYIENPFPGGESLKDVEKRVLDFLIFLKNHYDNGHIAIIAHQAPQLALDVLIRRISWKQAIDEDWRTKKAWKPGWEYILI